jgi:hypothetical protein
MHEEGKRLGGNLANLSGLRAASVDALSNYGKPSLLNLSPSLSGPDNFPEVSGESF